MKRFVLVASATVFAVGMTSCSRSTIGGSTCDESPPAAILRYPQPGTRNVSTALATIVISGADGNRATKLSLIDAGGTQTFMGPIERAERPPGGPDGIAYESADVNALAPGMTYVVLYSPIGCDGAMDYAIGSFSTAE